MSFELCRNDKSRTHLNLPILIALSMETQAQPKITASSVNEIESPTKPFPAHDFAANFRACVKADLSRLNHRGGKLKKVVLALTNRGFHALLLYRLAHACVRAHVPLLPLIFTRFAQTLFGVDIAPEAQLGPGIVIVHGIGLVVGGITRVEGDCCFYHGVTLGDRGSHWTNSRRKDGHPYVERGVMFGAGAKILGPIHIGDNCVIGANAVVLKDVPAHSVVAGNPAKVVGTVENTMFGLAEGESWKTSRE